MKFNEKELSKVNGIATKTFEENSYTITFTSEGYGKVKNNKTEKVIPFFVGYDKHVYFDDETYYINGNKRLPEYIVKDIAKLSK